MTLILSYIGILTAEGNEHKHQVRFLFPHLFAKLLFNTITSARFWSVMWGKWGVKRLTIR